MSSLLRVSPLHLDEEEKEEKKNQKDGEEGKSLYCCQGTLIDASVSENILDGSNRCWSANQISLSC